MTKKMESTKSKRSRKPKSKETLYVILWWHFQKPYAATVPTYDEAKWIADTRNGVVIEVLGKKIKIESIVDFYRRDDEGNPMPAEMRPYESSYPNTLVRI